MKDVVCGIGLRIYRWILAFARMTVVVHGFAAIFEVADVAFYELEVCSWRLAVGGFEGFVDVFLVACGEVVEADDLLVQFQQGFQ